MQISSKFIFSPIICYRYLQRLSTKVLSDGFTVAKWLKSDISTNIRYFGELLKNDYTNAIFEFATLSTPNQMYAELPVQNFGEIGQNNFIIFEQLLEITIS